MLRICHVCHESKPLEDFPKDQKGKDGRSFRCKECLRLFANEWYQRRRAEAGASYRRIKTLDEWSTIASDGVMVCRTCRMEKSVCEFRDSKVLPRRRSQCRECDRKRMAELHIQKASQRQAYYKRYRCSQYGLSPEEFDRMIEGQCGLCAICRRPLGPRFQTIDHCHRTGRVRGIVHAQCNLMIGNAGEDIDVLWGGITYLLAHGRHETNDLSTAQPTVEVEMNKETNAWA